MNMDLKLVSKRFLKFVDLITLKLWVFLLIILILLGLIIYCILCGIDSDITIALITAVGAIVTIIGSVYVNQKLSIENAKHQRALEIRRTKQDFYHKFTDSFMLRMTYYLNQNSIEFEEAEVSFCLERNRLPLYASQEIIEFIDKVAAGDGFTPDFKVYYEMVRRDLINEEFKDFDNLGKISITLPSEQTRRGTTKPQIIKDNVS